MQKTIEKTTIYNLINAGHLARQAMSMPLQSHALIPGDDAILFALANSKGESEKALSQLTSLDKNALDSRLARLEALQIIERNETDATIKLSDKGNEISNLLVANWQQLDDALIGELSKKQSKKLKKILNRFIKLLSL